MPVDKTGLTRREKLLLLIAVPVAVLALMVQFVYLPLSKQLTERRDVYDALSMEKARIETTLATEASIRSKRDAALKTFDGISVKFPYTSSSTEIGRMLTSLCESHNLAPTEQRLSDPVDFTAVIPEGSSAESVFSTVSAVMTVGGDYSNLKKLLDTVEKTDYLRVSRVSFGRRDVGESLFEHDKITIHFTVTLLKEGS